MDTKKLFLFSVLLCVPMLAFANVIWPALIAEEKIISLPIIAISLLIEWFFFQYLFKLDKKTALYYTIVANTVSTLVGVILRPILGLLWEVSFGLIFMIIFHWGTFNPITWVSVPVFGGAINALLELLTIKIIWKQKLRKKNYFLTWAVNGVTITFALVWMYYDEVFL